MTIYGDRPVSADDEQLRAEIEQLRGHLFALREALIRITRALPEWVGCRADPLTCGCPKHFALAVLSEARP